VAGLDEALRRSATYRNTLTARSTSSNRVNEEVSNRPTDQARAHEIDFLDSNPNPFLLQIAASFLIATCPVPMLKSWLGAENHPLRRETFEPSYTNTLNLIL
jgi:hypothetical protein